MTTFRRLTVLMLLLQLPAATIGYSQSQEDPMVRMTTNFGVIDIQLFPQQAPATTANFLQYVEDGFFDGLVFHRVMPGFVIQGGGFEPGMKKKATNPPIQNEADNGLENDRGTLSMARTNDPHSATSQFFISLADNDFLNHTAKNANGWGYAVFAKVVSGMDVVDDIAKTATGSRAGHDNVPIEDAIIEKVELIQ